MSKMKSPEYNENWNPMRDAYRNAEFNAYDTGPGVGLAAGNGVSTVQPYLVLKHPPKNLTKGAVKNLCDQHGRVTAVRYLSKSNYFFIDMATISDAEAVFRALENNKYGFKIVIGKQTEKENSNDFPRNDGKIPKTGQSDRTRQVHNGEQPQHHPYRLPKREQYNRPQFNKNPIITKEAYKNNQLLMANDPQKHFCIEDDAHDVERAGLLSDQNLETSKSQNQVYRSGRKLITLPENTRNILNAKCAQSEGVFNVEQKTYTHSAGGDKIRNLKTTGECEECQRVTDLMCGRCRAYYCSIVCQKKDWPKHRITCGRPKDVIMRDLASLDASANTIDEMESMEEEMSSPQTQVIGLTEIYMPMSGSEVIMTSYSKSNVIFIRPTSYEENIVFFKIISDINAAVNDDSLTPLISLPLIGQIVVCKFGEEYNRAMILSVQSATNIKLVAIDYGNIDIFCLDDLYEAPESVLNISRMSLPVILKDVPDVVMTNELRKFLNIYLDDIKLRVVYKNEDYIADKGVHSVELFDDSIGKSFNKAIASIVEPVAPTNEQVFHRSYLNKVPLKNGVNVELVVMDNSFNVGYICCTMKEYAFEITKIQIALQMYAKSLKPENYTPRVDELCIAKYALDGQWYRARAIEVVGNGCPAMLFIDYGNIDNVDIAQIRKYPQQFNYPIYTWDCEIVGLPEICTKQQVKKLKELLPVGSTIVCDSAKISEEENDYKITLHRVTEALKSHDLL